MNDRKVDQLPVERVQGGDKQAFSHDAPAHARVFTVLSRQWCHLCHELVEALEPIAQHYGWRVEVVDIEQEPTLEARWDELVPVLLAGDVEICHHRLDAEAVHAFCGASLIRQDSLVAD